LDFWSFYKDQVYKLPSDAGRFFEDWPPPRAEALPVSPPRLTAAVVMRGAAVVMRGAAVVMRGAAVVIRGGDEARELGRGKLSKTSSSGPLELDLYYAKIGQDRYGLNKKATKNA
jgi:hypothetical protein